MAQLAIKGHATRGSEVIALLEMLGGMNIHNLTGSKEIWYILSNCTIETSAYLFEEKGFTLEEFIKKFPYKVGDKVTHNMGILMNVVHMRWDAGCNVIRYDIQPPVDNNYNLKAMLAEHLQPYKEETIGTITIDDFKANTKEWLIDKLHGMIISEAIKTIGNIHDELHKPQYPKTYDECCEVLGYEPNRQSVTGYYAELIENFQKLLICRDAYWKIAGDWKPNFGENFIYAIGTCYGTVEKRMVTGGSGILLFPNEEMRDVFYENFKELIEQCKELL